MKSFYTVIWVTSPADMLKAEGVHVHISFVSCTAEDSEEPLLGLSRERRNEITGTYLDQLLLHCYI